NELEAASAAGARVIVTTHAGSLGFLCQRGTMMRAGRELCDGIVEPRKCTNCVLGDKGLPPGAALMAGLIPPALGAVARHLPGRFATMLAMTDLIARNQQRQRRMLDVVDKFVVLTGWAEQA